MNPSGAKTMRVIRGGGWDDHDARWVRSAARNKLAPKDWNLDIGFRCARPS
jgi:formylglycine-generating enzyme required for sulfatase activity